MHHLLFVDDEPAVVRGLAYDIDWSDLNVSGIYKACSVKEAIGHLERERIDVVVSDINMPGESGIALAEYVRRQWPSAAVIFLSGFDEFEYAQRAVELGVFQYVTKPVDYMSFKDTVRRALAKVEGEWVREQALLQAKARLEEQRPIVRERLLRDWLVRGDATAQGRLAAAGLELPPEARFVPVLLRAEGAGVKSGEEDPLLELTMKELLPDWLPSGAEGLFLYVEPGNWLAIDRCANQEDGGRALRRMEAQAEPFQASIRMTSGRAVSIFLGDPAAPRELSDVCRRLTSAARRAVADDAGTIRLLREEDAKSGAASPSHARLRSLHAAPELGLLLESLDMNACLARLTEVFAELESRPEILRADLLEVHYAVAGAVVQASLRHGLSLSQWSDGGELLMQPAGMLGRIADLREWCERAAISFAEQLGTREKQQSNLLIEQTKRIVDDQYMKDISVAGIASQLYVHPNYLTRLIKTHTGLSLMDHISRRRMEAAKLLLLEPGIKVYEVAESVGYESIAHFNRMFRRLCGMSPSDYQRSSAAGEM